VIAGLYFVTMMETRGLPVTALILCGGLGTRLRPVVGDLPKVLAQVAGHPYIDHVMTYLRTQGIVDTVLCTGYGAEEVAHYSGDGSRWGVRVRYSVEDAPLGTAGAVKHAESLIQSNPFIVLNGDSMIRADLPALVKFHERKDALITLVLTQVEDMTRYGSVQLGDDRSIKGFREKGQSGGGFINAGIYSMDRRILEAIPPERKVSLELEVLPIFAGRGMYGMSVADSFIDIGTPEAYSEAQSLTFG